MAGKNATLGDYHAVTNTSKPAPLATEPEITFTVDAVAVLTSDRLTFSELAQTIFATDGWEENALLSGMKTLCEQRIEAIDSALSDV